MSSDIAIRVEGLGKEYIIGHQKSGDLRSSFAEKISGALGRNKTKESFWALKDLDFEIKKGEAVGIIGRNGAGKSTLLKILSRITEPTTGRFEINGRVSSLLEVGTGFHMELTGRENIFLNGTILGMKRAEIKQKFDEIVDFSGVEKFLDTPVKHYSSGMKVRLAFSVAAHLEPEILIVDEVLAVGDAEFQKKCLGKMDEVSKNEGRTVIFVSHNMGAVQNLCEKGLLLSNGKLMLADTMQSTISRYLSSSEISNEGLYSFENNTLIRQVRLFSNKIPTSEIISGSEFIIECIFEHQENLNNIILGIAIKNSMGDTIMALNNRNIGDTISASPIREGKILVKFRELQLYREDDYVLDIFFGNNNDDLEIIKDKIFFKIIKADVYSSSTFLKSERNLFFQRNIEFNLK